MMLVNYGRQRLYHVAGTPVECRCCVHSSDRAELRDGFLWCDEHGRATPAATRCGEFWRAPGTDDHVGQIVPPFR